ncbi:MAG: hypothetical protein RL660_1307 [Bacteroidota bacterium]|jgi:methionyl-tRNA formyltransferase
MSISSTTELRIVFMGTPGFAVATLKALLDAKYNVVAVVTAPDKPAGRGQQLQMSEVKKFAVANDLPVLQPVKLKDENFLAELRSYDANLQVVVAFRMLPELVWNMPSLGTYNVHASLLPQYRGAAPINWAIINGETKTGVTIFKLVHDIDKGNILLQKSIDISVDDNAGTVHDALMVLGANAMVETLSLIANGLAKEVPQQEHEVLHHAPKIFTEQCIIDFNKTAQAVCNQVRGLCPYPGALTKLGDKTFKVYSCAVADAHDGDIGSVHSDGKTFLQFNCLQGAISCKEVQLEGKKRMPIEDFLRGWKM